MVPKPAAMPVSRLTSATDLLSGGSSFFKIDSLNPWLYRMKVS